MVVWPQKTKGALSWRLSHFGWTPVSQACATGRAWLFPTLKACATEMTRMTIASNEVDGVVLERIQKLIALTTSPNLNEAANAAAKVQELLDSHSLGMSQVTAHEAGTVQSGLPITSVRHVYGPRHSPMNQAWQWLMNVLGVQHHCRTFTGPSRDPRTGKTGSMFVVVGDPTNVQATVTLFEWLRTPA